jgi:hypothetical protein
MLDMARAMQVTENCIRETANLFPPSEFPIQMEDSLLKLRIDKNRIELLKTNIAGNSRVGLPSLTPPRKINPAVLKFKESSTLADVFTIVRNNAVLA